MGMATDTVCITLMVHGCWIQNATQAVTNRSEARTLIKEDKDYGNEE
jgi:hypothetical protein